jgi:hypothetical protein
MRAPRPLHRALSIAASVVLLRGLSIAAILFLLAACSDVGDSTVIPDFGAGNSSADASVESSGGSEDAAVNDAYAVISDSAPAVDTTAPTDSTVALSDATTSESDVGPPDVVNDATSIEDAAADVLGTVDANDSATSTAPESGADAVATESDAGSENDAADATLEGDAGEGGPATDAGEDAKTPDSGSDASADAAANHDAGSDASGGARSACTTAPCAPSGPNSVTCSPGGNEVCTATEAAIVNGVDIPKGLLTGGQLNPCDPNMGVCAETTSCYACLVNNDCIDDTVNPDVNKECEDLPSGSSDVLDGVTSNDQGCLNVEACWIASGCVDQTSAAPCYCGTQTGTECLSNPGNGPCVGQVIDGLGNIAGDTCSGVPTAAPTASGTAVCEDTASSATTVSVDFTDTTRPTGRVYGIFSCAYNNCWPMCQSPSP